VVEHEDDLGLVVVSVVFEVGLGLGVGLKEDVRGLYEPALLGVDMGLALVVAVFPDVVVVLVLVGVVGVVEEDLTGFVLFGELVDFIGSTFLTLDALGEVTLGVSFTLLGFTLDETGLFFFPTSSSAFPPTAFGAVFRTLTAAFPAEAVLNPAAGLLVSGVTESFFSWSFSSM